MTKKHIAIEVLPRALWVIQGIILYIYGRPEEGSFIINGNIVLLFLGACLAIAGIIFLIWTFVFLAKPMFTKELMVTGPYGYARHPMYVSMYVILVGVGIIVFSIQWFVILLLFVPVWYIDCKIEEGQMIDLCGDKYLEYKKSVGMFFP